MRALRLRVDEANARPPEGLPKLQTDEMGPAKPLDAAGFVYFIETDEEMTSLKAVLRNGGKIEVWLSDHGLEITLRNVHGKSRGSIDLDDLRQFLAVDSHGLTLRENAYPCASSTNHTLELRVSALEAIVAAIHQSAAVDPVMNDIALGLCGKPFPKLTASQQDTVRQIATRATVVPAGDGAES